MRMQALVILMLCSLALCAEQAYSRSYTNLGESLRVARPHIQSPRAACAAGGEEVGDVVTVQTTLAGVPKPCQRTIGALVIIFGTRKIAGTPASVVCTVMTSPTSSPPAAQAARGDWM